MDKFFEWAVLPDNTDAISDYGIKPIAKIFQELDDNATSAEMIVALNKILDVVHCRGDLSSMFIEGGQLTLARISNDRTLEESFEGVIFDEKSVKAPIKNKIKKLIYKVLNKNGTTKKIYSDETWEGPRLEKKDVEEALDMFNNMEYTEDEFYTAQPPMDFEVEVGPAQYGGYRTSADGHNKWKEYNILIYLKDAKYPFMGGIVTCSAAGTVDNPFEKYDLTVLF